MDHDESRRAFLKKVATVTVSFMLGESGLWLPEADALTIRDHPSPRRNVRPNRKSTDFIVLHTTEANGNSSLNSLAARGKANYMIDTNGDTYRIMKPRQVAIACGRSMWKGRTNLDKYATSIEFVGYHHRKPTKRQYDSGRELIAELQRLNGISDRNVMPHSQVAYGKPNRYHRRSHRGRKRCGMLFGTDEVRKKLGLTDRHTYDPDINAGRLVNADPYLSGVLYGKRPAEGMPMFAEAENGDNGHVFSKLKTGEPLWPYTGDEYIEPTTIYWFPSGEIRRGDELERAGFDFNHPPIGLRVATGYVYGGHVSEHRSAYSIAGSDWNSPSTFYVHDSQVKTGDDVVGGKILPGTLVLFRN